MSLTGCKLCDLFWGEFFVWDKTYIYIKPTHKNSSKSHDKHVHSFDQIEEFSFQNVDTYA